MRNTFHLFLALFAIALCTADGASAQQSERPVTYSQVANIFPPTCWFCHGWLKGKSADFYMGSHSGMLEGVYRGGTSRRLLVPGDAENSILVKRIEGRLLPRMPLDRPPLRDDEIKLIRRWIDDGAKGDARTAEERELAMHGVKIQRDGQTLFLSCRAPKDLQNMGIRVKIIDERTGAVLLQDWPVSEFDLKGRWSQWEIKLPPGSISVPSTVSIRLLVTALFGVISSRSDYDEFDGVIFLLDSEKTKDGELLRQVGLLAATRPKSPPHKGVDLSFQLATPSNVQLDVYAERHKESLFSWKQNDLPANKNVLVPWDFIPSKPVAPGWYNARIRADSTIPGQIQPDLAILFNLRSSP